MYELIKEKKIQIISVKNTATTSPSTFESLKILLVCTGNQFLALLPSATIIRNIFFFRIQKGMKTPHFNSKLGYKTTVQFARRYNQKQGVPLGMSNTHIQLYEQSIQTASTLAVNSDEEMSLSLPIQQSIESFGRLKTSLKTFLEAQNNLIDDFINHSQKLLKCHTEIEILKRDEEISQLKQKVQIYERYGNPKGIQNTDHKSQFQREQLQAKTKKLLVELGLKIQRMDKLQISKSPDEVYTENLLLCQELEQLKSQLQNALAKISSRDHENEQLRQELEQVKSQLQNALAKISSKNHENKLLKQKVTSLQTRASEQCLPAQKGSCQIIQAIVQEHQNEEGNLNEQTATKKIHLKNTGREEEIPQSKVQEEQNSHQSDVTKTKQKTEPERVLNETKSIKTETPAQKVVSQPTE